MNRIIVFSVLTITLLFSTTFSILVEPGSATIAWYHEDWPYRKKFTIDPVKVNCDLVNFPVLVSRSSDTDLDTNAQSDGDDILFTDSNQQKLDHEIEYYNAGTLYAWVEVPSLSSSSDTDIYMYYGNGAVSSQQNPAGVWDSNYKMVQHLSETSGPAYDSTSNNNDGTPRNGTDQTIINGKIDGDDKFDGTDDCIEVPDSITLNTISTIELWFKPTNTYSSPNTEFDGLISKRNSSGYYEGWSLSFYGGAPTAKQGKIQLENDPGDSVSIETLTTTAAWTAGTWYHVAFVLDGVSGKAYVNGIDDTDTFWTTETGSALTDSDTSLVIAKHISDLIDYFPGEIDEVRISSVPRSACWILTGYENQNSPVAGGFFSAIITQELSNFQSTITITSSPITGSSIIKVDGASISTPQPFDWIKGSSHTLTALSPVTVPDHRYVWSNWSDTGLQSHLYTVPVADETVTAFYVEQFYLTVNSDHDAPQGEGWYNASATATFSVTSPAEYVNGTRYFCIGFTVDETGYGLVSETGTNGTTTMNQNKTITFLWDPTPQYYLTVNSTYGTTHGEGWYNPGDTPTFYVTPEIVEEDGVRHVFQGWEGDYIDGANPAGAHQIVMDGPKTVTAVWRDRFFIEIISPYGSPPGSSWPFRGENFEVSVTSPDSGFVVTGHKVDGGSLQSGSSHMFINVQATHTIEFVWELLIETTTFTFNLGTNPGNKGTIAVGTTVYDDGDSIITTGGSYTIQANPDDDYIFSRWQTSGGVSVSTADNSITTCTVSGNGTLTMIQDKIPTPAAPGVWGGPETQFQCIIATAAYGSTMAPEVAHMRNVRDNMIGSTPIGKTLVSGFNTFYYSWSPPVAQWIADSEGLRTTFRVLLLPISAAVHSAELVYTTVSPLSLTMASITAFLLAAAISIGTYIVAPIFAGLTIYRKKYASRT